MVIPKPIRDKLGIAPGDDVVFVAGDDDVRIRRSGGMASLAGTLGAYDLRAELEAEHRREIETEERQLARVERRRA